MLPFYVNWIARSGIWQRCGLESVEDSRRDVLVGFTYQSEPVLKVLLLYPVIILFTYPVAVGLFGETLTAAILWMLAACASTFILSRIYLHIFAIKMKKHAHLKILITSGCRSGRTVLVYYLLAVSIFLFSLLVGPTLIRLADNGELYTYFYGSIAGVLIGFLMDRAKVEYLLFEDVGCNKQGATESGRTKGEPASPHP